MFAVWEYEVDMRQFISILILNRLVIVPNAKFWNDCTCININNLLWYDASISTRKSHTVEPKRKFFTDLSCFYLNDGKPYVWLALWKRLKTVAAGKNRMQSPFAKWLKGPSKELHLYQNAANRKIKLVSSKEIADAQDLESFGTRKLKSCARTEH